MSIEIKPGKWRMRNGECAVVEFISSATAKCVVIGYLERDRSISTWTRAGKEYSDSDSPFDLIEPWTDKPVVNWSAMPAWAKWVAMDEDGDWWWFVEKVYDDGHGWAGGGFNGFIPSQFRPKFTGNWRDSLVERPAE